MGYIANFFFNDKKTEEWLHSNVVTPDFAVCVERVDSNREWYLIEERADADFQKREFNTSHPLIQSLIGKKIGDAVQIKRSAHNEEFAKIVEIKSKYVYALHETCSLYETMFPDRNDFWSINIKESSSDGEEGGINIDKIRNMLAARSKMVNEVMELYQTGGLTIGVVGELLGLTAHETWEALLANHKKLTFCSNGNQSFLEHTISLLSTKEPPRLATDITSIHLARLLKVENKIVEHFGKLLVAPTTLFSLYRKLEEIKKNRGSSLLSLSEQNGVLYKNEIAPEEVEKIVVYLEELIRWIENNCESSAHQNGFDIERNHKSQLKEALLPEFFDTTLIVKDEGYLLFTEDDWLGRVSRHEIGIKRVWMQLVLILLKNKGIISKEKYAEAILQLASTNLTHIHLDAEALLEAARKSGWSPNAHYLNAVKRLQGGRADIHSATTVAVNFLIFLDRIPLTSEKRRSLIFSLLGNLSYLRSQREVLSLLVKKIVVGLYFSPLRREKILSDVMNWKTNQFIMG